MIYKPNIYKVIMLRKHDNFAYNDEFLQIWNLSILPLRTESFKLIARQYHYMFS